MKVIQDERGMGPTNPVAAILDIKRRNEENEANFTEAQKMLATKLRTLMQAAHSTSRVFKPNYRKGQISVKADNYRARDKLSPEYDKLVAFCDKHNITVRHTASKAAIYSIKI